MTKLNTLCITLCIAATTFVSCSSSEELLHNNRTTASRTRKPQFIDDISLGGGSTNSIRTNTGNSKNKGGSSGTTFDNTFASMLQTKYGSVLSVIPQTITNVSLYSFIDSWYGTRYRMGGNDRDGIDCSAFVQRLYQDVFCVNLVRTAFEQFNTCRMIWDTAGINEGDLVFFRAHGKRISHVGIYLANNFFVHASSSGGVMISSLKEQYWSHRFAGAGQIPRG